MTAALAERLPPAKVPRPQQPPAATPRRRAESLAARERRLRTHRVCDPQDAEYVFRMCLIDRSILPRYHQSDRGPRPQSQGVHRMAPPGSYIGVLSWPGRHGWLFALSAAAWAKPKILSNHQVSAKQLRDAAQVLSGYAQDQRTGRRCIAKPRLVASVLVSCRRGRAVHERTVQRCLAALRELGFLVTIQPGRMLDLEEKTQAQRGHSAQSGFSTDAALTVPPAVADSHSLATPSRGRVTTSETTPESSPLDHQQTKATSSRPGKRASRRGPPARELAGKVVKLFPWLGPESPRRLESALKPFVESRPAWTAQDLHDAIQTDREARGMVTALTPDHIHTRPAVVFAGLLRRLDPHDDHPRLATIDPAELRCGRPECDHGWIGDEVVHKCDQCRPGAWPDALVDQDGQDLEPPF